MDEGVIARNRSFERAMRSGSTGRRRKALEMDVLAFPHLPSSAVRRNRGKFCSDNGMCTIGDDGTRAGAWLAEHHRL